MRLALAGDDHSILRSVLNGNVSTNATSAVVALGNTKDSRAIPYLLPLIQAEERATGHRKAIVQALARTEAGATALLDLARQDQLPDDLRFATGAELASVRWPDIQSAAAEMFPLPPGQNAEPLPALSTLLNMKGDPVKGRAVFERELTQCAACHRVNGEGKEVGPDLSEIGTKLGKDALYEAILGPSAGVSFGYEAYELELSTGDEAFGLIVSETPEDLAVKDTQGIVTRYPKSTIKSRRQMRLSIMPAGLQMTMSTQELVDLVEFLASLKKR
jgi:putative heme-binding domain-containing protein